jgi:hypothetical protein
MHLKLAAGAEKARYRACSRATLFSQVSGEIARIATAAAVAESFQGVHATCWLTQLKKSYELLVVLC